VTEATPFRAPPRAAAALSALALVISSCARPPTPAAPGARIPAEAAVPAEASAAALPPPTAEEKALAERLRATVALLAGIGERTVEKSLNLATATDEIALALEKIGYAVRRQGFAAGDAIVQNLEVVVPGGERGAETLVVGAHFDTVAGTPGADDNASGVAAVLELSRAFRERKPSRTVRIAFFTNEEAPYFMTDEMGSRVYAKALVAEGVTVVGMLDVESIGYYSVAPGSQRYPAEIARGRPTIGDFVALVGTEPSRAFLELSTAAMRKHATLPVRGEVLPEALPGVVASDHASFLALGIPAVMITDTAPYRSPHYHRATDVPDSLDYDRMSRVVAGLVRTVEDLAR
jgi:hypothetical protein